MEERTIKLTLDKAKEWYKKGGELKEVSLQAYTEEELTKVELPTTWEEFCLTHIKKDEERCINAFSVPVSAGINTRDSILDRNVMPSEEAAKAHLALMQLHQLRDCYRQGWRQDGDTELCYAINKVFPNHYEIMGTGRVSRFLSFPTKKMAEVFLHNFIDLIEQAGDLI